VLNLLISRLHTIWVEILGFDRFGFPRIAEKIHNESHLSGSLLPLKPPPRFRELHQFAEREGIGIYACDSGKFEDEFIN